MIENLFPTPIYKVKLDDKILKQWKDIYKDLKNKDKFQYKEGWNSHKLSDVTFRENLIERYAFYEFQKAVEEHIEQYLLQMNFHKPSYFRFVECWMTEYSKGDYAHMHTHLPGDISGVFYVKQPKDEGGGDIFFLNPNQMVNTFTYRQLGDRHFYTPEEGTLILFPSWLNHGVTPNRTDSERVSVAFNIYFMRDYDWEWNKVVDNDPH